MHARSRTHPDNPATGPRPPRRRNPQRRTAIPNPPPDPDHRRSQRNCSPHQPSTSMTSVTPNAVRRPRKTTAPPELTRRKRTMFPALTYPTTEAHRDDLYRDARRRHRTEVRVRERLGRARRTAVIHRPRSTLIAGHSATRQMIADRVSSRRSRRARRLSYGPAPSGSPANSRPRECGDRASRMPRPRRPTRPNHDACCPRTQSGHDSDTSGPVPTTPIGHRQSRSRLSLIPARALGLNWSVHHP